MTADHINDQASEKEIRIKNTKFNNIVTVLHQLPEYIRTANQQQQILSIIQNTNSIFIKFESNKNAVRAKTMYEREGMEIEWSKTYVCLCKEIVDDEPVERASNRKNSNRSLVSARSTGNDAKSTRKLKRGKSSLIVTLNDNSSRQISMQNNVSRHKRKNDEVNGKCPNLPKNKKNDERTEDVLILNENVQFSDEE